MNYLQNHIWCSRSNWDGATYNCTHLVTIMKFEDNDANDYRNVIDPNSETFIDTEYLETIKRFNNDKFSEQELKNMCIRNVSNLKHHVLQWLFDNVKDRRDKEQPKGWAIGSLDYRYKNTEYFSIFFHRRRDAMAFIKEFSEYKKPVEYCQYFKDIRKTLNVDTGKYISY